MRRMTTSGVDVSTTILAPAVDPSPEGRPAAGDVAANIDADRVADTGTGNSPVGLLARRKWAVIATMALIAMGLAYMFAWNPVVRHVNAWATPGDVWEIFRGAHSVGWGYLGGVYDPGNQIVAFPGLEVLLAPVAMLSGHLRLTESYSPFFIPHPTAALVLQPVVLLLTGTVIFATDALAERLRIDRGRRIVLCFVVALIALPVAAVWGHAEDALAMTFAIYALIAMLDRKWSRCGWLIGFGIVMQPLVLLLLPLILGATPAGQRALTAVRSAALSVVLLTVAFIGNPADTYRAVVQQPAFPTANHVTPWLATAPMLSTGSTRTSGAVSLRYVHGRFSIAAMTGPIHQAVVVTGGLGRSLYMIIALLLGAYVWRRPQTQMRLLWLAAAILSTRCFFEAVMCPYYLAPPLFLALVLVARSNRARFWSAVAIALATSVYAYFHLSPWVWWLPVVAGLATVLALGYPGGGSVAPQGEESSESDGVTRMRGGDRSREPTVVR